ncbi:hypothetical protein BJ546DRAFT_5760 [Cryomyces antarcticus]|nr:hypothetical protein LTR39_003345 [Cryomyces antarcticus]KAK5014552.1 hypothetical protein LTR60_003303 [Cryomyces antarcticus]KAK5146807.1 hypothetical protein LTR04_000963 [Oleoguttula sp. CCFEE 6159]
MPFSSEFPPQWESENILVPPTSNHRPQSKSDHPGQQRHRSTSLDLENQQDLQSLHRSLSHRSGRSSSPAKSAISTASPPAPPKTIFLCTWSSAPQSQISRYVAGYETLYPSAIIQVLTPSSSSSSFPQPELKYSDNPATDTSSASEKELLTEDPTTLLHIFGNSGAATACRLLQTYRARTGRSMGVKTIVLDAAPSASQACMREMADLMHALREQSVMENGKALITTIARILLLLFTISLATMFGGMGARSDARKVRQDLNDPKLIPDSVRWCYVLPGSQLLFSWADSGEEFREVEQKEWSVKREKVDDMSRWSGDEERYWGGIESVWEGRK